MREVDWNTVAPTEQGKAQDPEQEARELATCYVWQWLGWLGETQPDPEDVETFVGIMQRILD